jgi:SAM-dependent methyltransferase
VARGESLRWRVVRPLFELLYRSRTLYWLASTIPFAGQWRTWQRLAIPRLRGRDVLEVGCGTGTLLVDMLRAGYDCRAIDRSPQMVAATRDRLRRAGYDPAQFVRQAEIQRLPLADATFDDVVSTFPTDYIVDPAALREVARVLRPGGRFVVVLGASLLPANTLLWPFVAVQRVVYGPSPRAHAEAAQPGTSAAGAAAGMPQSPLVALLRAAGLRPTAEAVRGPFWVAHLVLGEKSGDNE